MQNRMVIRTFLLVFMLVSLVAVQAADPNAIRVTVISVATENHPPGGWVDGVAKGNEVIAELNRVWGQGYSWGQKTVYGAAFGWLRLPITMTRCQDVYSGVRTYLSTQGLTHTSQINPLFILTPRGSGCGSSASVSTGGYLEDARAYVHEFGHVLGLGHGAVEHVSATRTWIEHRGDNGPMGKSLGAPISPVSLEKLGWVNPPFTFTPVTASGTYRLPPYGPPTPGVKYLKISLPNTPPVYVVLYRFYRAGVLAGEVQLYKACAFSARDGSDDVCGLDMDTMSEAFDRVLDAGQSVTLHPSGPTPVRVTTKAVSTTGATIEVAFPGGTPPLPDD